MLSFHKYPQRLKCVPLNTHSICSSLDNLGIFVSSQQNTRLSTPTNVFVSSDIASLV
jgi:hypothetical protein